jgi:CheY-like chemotaxis protein
MLTMILKKRGLVTESRENGQKAVDLILADLHAFKLVLMDNLMPVLTGQEAARSLREHGYPYLIIGITGIFIPIIIIFAIFKSFLLMLI